MQQLSLPLNLPGIYSEKVVWFQEMLRSLGVCLSPALYDNFGKSLRNWLDFSQI